MKTIEGPVSIPLPYDEAWLYCATLTCDNKYDWRMPSSLEYNDLSMGKTWYIERLMAYKRNDNSGKLKVVPLRTMLIEQAEKNKIKLSYDIAWLYCATLTQDNKYDWRMPTFPECSIYNMDSHWFSLPHETYAYAGVAWYIHPVRDL